MKTNHLQKLVLITAATVLAGSESTVLAQDTSADGAVQPAAANASVPHFAYGVSQILKLAQAEVGDEIIIAYIRNSRSSYGLDSKQISYLRQQGVFEAVITTMLSQPGPRVSEDAATPPAPPTAALINRVEPAAAVEAVPATVGDPEPAAPIASGTTTMINHELAADAHAETAFVYYPDPLAPGGNGPTVTVIYYQSAPVSPVFYQRQLSPVLGGYSVVSPGIGIGRLGPAGWSGGLQNTRRFRHDCHR